VVFLRTSLYSRWNLGPGCQIPFFFTLVSTLLHEFRAMLARLLQATGRTHLASGYKCELRPTLWNYHRRVGPLDRAFPQRSVRQGIGPPMLPRTGDTDRWPGNGGGGSSDGVDCERDERGAQGIGSERRFLAISMPLRGSVHAVVRLRHNPAAGKNLLSIFYDQSASRNNVVMMGLCLTTPVPWLRWAHHRGGTVRRRADGLGWKKGEGRWILDEGWCCGDCYDRWIRIARS
jgi:hypothetical protein